MAPDSVLRLLRVLFGLLLLFPAAVGAAGPPGRPNVVFILADDLGWRDLGCYGHPYHETPHLDRLAREGMRFTQAYAAAPICSASRAALLTGRTPARLGFEFVTKEQAGGQKQGQLLQSPSFTLDLPLAEVTVGEMLGGAGYRTGFFGKWHVSRHEGGYLGWSSTHGPRQQGFAEGDATFGSHPYGYGKAAAAGAGADLPEGTFPADALTDRVLAFVREGRGRPFFLHWSHYYVHDPVQTRCRWLLEKYRRKVPAGVGAREVRAAYGAMVEALDHEVGRLLRELEGLGLRENTLVIVTSDNGGHPGYTANGPLRGGKWNLYEGGLRVPLLARWPGRVPAGRESAEPVAGWDLFETLREVGGAREDGVARDGRSLGALLRGEAWGGAPRPLVWHFPYYHPETRFAQAPARTGVDDWAVSQTRPQSAIRVGRHKLLHFYEEGRDELYDLEADPGEQRDLASAQPGQAGVLRRQLEEALRAVQARLPVRSAGRGGL
ncbi:MAG: hypothetical protein RJA22_1486 [Verrucomicrobiota bacterium]|jgi:uncharacterized sulfatase